MCRVVYTRGGTQYGAMMKTPAELDDVRVAMLAKNPPVAAKDIVRIEPVTPLTPIHRGHPAQHKLVKYAALAACVVAFICVGCASTPKVHGIELPARLDPTTTALC